MYSLSDSTFRNFGFDAEIVPSSTFRVFSEAIMYFSLGPPSWCLFGDISFSGELWILGGVDIFLQCKILLSVLLIVCFRYRQWQFSVVPYISLPKILSDLSSPKMYKHIGFFHQTALTASSSVTCGMNNRELFFRAMTMWSVTSPFSLHSV